MKKLKHLVLFWILSGSLDCFCQTEVVSSVYTIPSAKLDTIRVTLIVYYDRGPAVLHTKPGFVVRQFGKEDVFLDDNKRRIKSPLEVDHYRIKKQ